MLPRQNRLSGEENFARVQKEGGVFQSQNFGIAKVVRGDGDASRFAFIVSNKIAQDAVDRNRIKRMMREAVRVSLVDMKPGLDIVFLAKPSITRVPTEEVIKEVKVALKESGLIK